jgi:hypothetical protein
LQIKTNTVSCHTADSKPVKQEVNGTVIRPPLVFPVSSVRGFIEVGSVLEVEVTEVTNTLAYRSKESNKKAKSFMIKPLEPIMRMYFVVI